MTPVAFAPALTTPLTVCVVVIAGGAVFDDGVACADRQVQNFQTLSGLQLETAAGMEIKLINSDAVCIIAIAGMIVRERAAV